MSFFGSHIQQVMNGRRSRTFFLAVFALVALLGQGLPVASAATAPVAAATLTPQYEKLAAQANAKGAVRVIIGLKTAFVPEGNLADGAAVDQQRDGIARAQDGLLQRLSGKRARLEAKFQFIPYMAMTLDAAALQAVASDAGVTNVFEDELNKPVLAESVPLIGANANGSFGTAQRTGAGKVVAILDTGVMKTHSFLTGKVVSEACYSTTDTAQGSTAVCTPNSTAANSGLHCSVDIDGCDHGTHVAGIVAGKGTGATTFNGVAKDAQLIAIQVFSKFTGANCGGFPNPDPCVLTYSSDQIKGLERVYALRNTYSIAAANMSLGGGSAVNTNCDAEQAPRKAAIDTLLAVGIATVIASGNAGFTNGVGNPACISTAVTVGSTTKQDTVADYSNSGNPIDLLAPGSDINSSVTTSTTAFGSKNGTSMATPHVAGAWAVLKQHKPTASVAELQTALQNTGVAITDNRNGLVRKRISLTKAVNALVTAPNPVPVLTSLSHAGVVAGAPGFVLTATGSNFINGSIIRWKGANRTTTFISATQLRATITAADIATAGTAAVTVFTPTPGGGTSAARTITVVSACNRYEPNNTLATAQAIAVAQIQTHAFCATNDQDWLKFSAVTTNRYQIDTLGLATGVNTVMSLYNASGTALVQETVDASTPVTSQILFVPPANGTYYIKLRNRTTAASANHTYNVRIVQTVVPRITSLTPPSREAGFPAFTLVVKGSSFVNGSIVRWKGANRTTTYVSATELRASITAADIATAGTAQVHVLNPAANGGLSAPVNFTITAPQAAPKPAITTLSPTTATAGGASFLLIVKGTNFHPRSYITFNNTKLTTTYVSATQLRATVSAGFLTRTGVRPVVVNTPAPGGGLSNAVNFTIVAPANPCTTDEPNDTIAQAKVYSPLGTVKNYAHCTAWDNDYISLQATSNTKYRIEVFNVAPNADPVVEVYNPDQSLLGSIDSAGSGQSEIVILTVDPNEGGKFFINVRQWLGMSGNDYTYSVKITLETGLVSGGADAATETIIVTGNPNGDKEK